MKALPLRITERGYVPCPSSEATHIKLRCPGPYEVRIIPVGDGGWDWNKSIDLPTLSPSVKTWAPRPLSVRELDAVHAGASVDVPDIVCHSWVKEGKIRFLLDCDHALAGRTMDLLDIDFEGCRDFFLK